MPSQTLHKLLEEQTDFTATQLQEYLSIPIQTRVTDWNLEPALDIQKTLF